MHSTESPDCSKLLSGGEGQRSEMLDQCIMVAGSGPCDILGCVKCIFTHQNASISE